MSCRWMYNHILIPFQHQSSTFIPHTHSWRGTNSHVFIHSIPVPIHTLLIYSSYSHQNMKGNSELNFISFCCIPGVISAWTPYHSHAVVTQCVPFPLSLSLFSNPYFFLTQWWSTSFTFQVMWLLYALKSKNHRPPSQAGIPST